MRAALTTNGSPQDAGDPGLAARLPLAGTSRAVERLASTNVTLEIEKMARTASLPRMVLPEHECPHGVRAKEMLDEAGFTVDEHILSTRDEVDAFKAKYGVATTPSIEIDGDVIGGAADLERFLADA